MLVVELAVRYGQGQQQETDQYRIQIGPLGDASGKLEIVLRSPTLGTSAQNVLPARYASGCDSLAVLAIKASIQGLFGQERPAPRIVGLPEWSGASLQITRVRPHLSQTLRRYELSVESSITACLMRYQGPMLAAMETFELCREDADPLYALTRLTLRSETAQALAVKQELPSRSESLTDPAMLRQSHASRVAVSSSPR
ncbi:hypothetical protein [Eleftheria terrae]|uniref:hypothetical protein n=1 Tax=Eleftheria terrae TaxID=1597781 RepID=UPI00263B2C8C|nr:hypothetical protein [Eleftheria terrae]WKB51761.1 hypothetical protein N7L95_18435 [Eleftheria terrae]